MPVYSHSRISTFETCPLKFKFRYIDKVETEIENTVEAFMGDLVHQALEKLYRDLLHKKFNSPEELVKFYNALWKKNWNRNILIVRKEYTQENYRKMGEDYILRYYERHQPFDTRTIACESLIFIKLDEKHKLRGYMDRLDMNVEGIYEIHDYKTSLRLPTQEEIEKDRQLALYSLYVRENYPDCKDVKLRWHYLAFDKILETTKDKKELDKLRKEIIAIIDRIEKEKEFKPIVNSYCDWCEFKPLCPKWMHMYKIEGKDPSSFLEDKGVKLVNKFADLKYKVAEINRELSELKSMAVDFARKEGVSSIFGSNHKLNVNISSDIKLPSKAERDKLISELKRLGKIDEVIDVDVFALKKVIKQEIWPSDILKKISKFVSEVEAVRVSLAKFEREE